MMIRVLLFSRLVRWCASLASACSTGLPVLGSSGALMPGRSNSISMVASNTTIFCLVAVAQSQQLVESILAPFEARNCPQLCQRGRQGLFFENLEAINVEPAE